MLLTKTVVIVQQAAPTADSTAVNNTLTGLATNQFDGIAILGLFGAFFSTCIFVLVLVRYATIESYDKERMYKLCAVLAITVAVTWTNFFWIINS